MIVALTGGVGAGKSSVSALLAEHGAVIVDADLIAREVVEPGTPGLAAVVAEFGAGILAAEGSLDRAALAEIVFHDDSARLRLNAILHPLIGDRTAELIAAAPAGSIVVNDIPLLAESRRSGYDVVIVVVAGRQVRLERLEKRGMGPDEAEARMAAQASDEQRLALADEVVHNDGTREELAAQVDALWARLVERNRALTTSEPG